MIFAYLLAGLGLLAYVLSENVMCLLLVISAMGKALIEYDKLNEKVIWLETKLKERDDNAQ